MTWKCGINRTRGAEREEKTTRSGGQKEGNLSKALGSWISQRLFYAEWKKKMRITADKNLNGGHEKLESSRESCSLSNRQKHKIFLWM